MAGMHIAMADADKCVGIYRRERNVLESGKEVLTLLALLAQKYKY